MRDGLIFSSIAWSCAGLRRSGFQPSKEIEVLILLPLGRLVTGDDFGVFQITKIAAILVALELEEVIDEHVAQLGAEQRFLVERVERLGKTLRQHGSRRRIGFDVSRSGIQFLLDAGEA